MPPPQSETTIDSRSHEQSHTRPRSLLRKFMAKFIALGEVPADKSAGKPSR